MALRVRTAIPLLPASCHRIAPVTDASNDRENVPGIFSYS